MTATIELHRVMEMCTRGIELLPLSTLCCSIASIGMKEPVIVEAQATLAHCVMRLAEHKTGNVVVVDHSGALVGIFTERDCVTKVLGKVADLEVETVEAYMTSDPVCERPDATLAFALNLMSHGGFRHLPIVDDSKGPIGTVSAKDVVDYIVMMMLKGIDDSIGA